MTVYAPPRPRVRRPAPMDPRIRDRRVAVKRAEGRRRLHRLELILGSIGIAAAAVGAVLSPLLDVNGIAVQGVDGAHAEEVRAAVGIDRGEALLLVDIGTAEQRVEALEWVDEVSISRQLPGTLEVEVIPRFPVASRTAKDGTVVLVDARGVEVARASVPAAGLPQITAQGRADIRSAARIAGALSSKLRPLVREVVVVNGQAVLRLFRGPEIRYGDASDARAKATATELMLQALGGKPATYVDVREPSAPVTG